MSAVLRFAVLAALVGSTLEVALRASPKMGLDAGQVAVWLVLAVVLSLIWTVGSALLVRRHGLVAGVYIGVLAAINYRFEFVLNNFVRDWRVWAVMPVLFLAGVGLGMALERVWRRLPRVLWGLPVIFAGVALVRSHPVSGVPSERPNVLVISLDTTRWDHVADKPHLARLMKEGTTFSQAIAPAPITEPGHLAMLTGIPPYRSGIVSNGTDLGDRPALLWRALQPRGWLTAAFVSGFPLHSKYGWGQGIDVYDDDFGALPGRESLSLVKLYNQVAIKEHALRERPAHLTLSHAVPWLRAHHDETFFAFVHFYDAHGPYESDYNDALGPAPVDGAPLALPHYWPARDKAITSIDWLKKAYDGEVRLTDDAIGALLETIAPVLDNTIVIVTADHGESLTEHDYLFDHGDNLYDPSLRIPLIVRFPPVVKAGQVVDCQVAGFDVAPTVLDLLGVQDGQARDGVSRVPELRGEPCRAGTVVASATTGRFVEKPPVDHALRTEVEKLILHEAGAVELYDLKLDPGERVNRSAEPRSKEVEALLRHMLGNAGEVTGPNSDAETQKMLEELGYLNGGAP